MKFTFRLKAALIATSLIAAPALAQASVTFLSYGTALPNGETLITDFSTMNNVVGGAAANGTTDASAAPAYSATTFDTAQYLSVPGGGSATLTFAPSKEVSVYIGSLDAYNTLSFGGLGAATFTGADLGAISGGDNGDRSGPNTNGRFVFTFDQAVTSATFQSTSNAFEVADVAGNSVPEPASWALMLVGFGGMGAAFRRQRRGAAVAV